MKPRSIIDSEVFLKKISVLSKLSMVQKLASRKAIDSCFHRVSIVYPIRAGFEECQLLNLELKYPMKIKVYFLMGNL